MKIFDTEGVSLLQTMTKGAAGIRETREEARLLGLTLSKEQTDGAAKANNAMGKFSATLSGIIQLLANEMY